METDLTDRSEIPVWAFVLAALISSRLLITASSGGGKSRAIRSLVEQTHGQVQQIIFDPEGEFGSLRERFPYLLAGTDGEVPATPETARLLCRRVMDLNVSVVIDLYDLPLAQRRAYVRQFLDELMHLPREQWRPLLVIIDEGHLFAPERGTGEAESLEAVVALASQGRKRGYCLALATQRLSKLSKDVAAELLNKLVGRTSLDNDVTRAGDDLGMDKAGRRNLKLLSPGTFYAVGPAMGENGTVHLVRTGPVLTTHPEPGKIAPPAPPTPDAIKALAAQFGDLPKEADAEAETIETLRKQLQEARSGQAVRTVEKIVQKEVVKYVPVLDAAQVESIQSLIKTALDVSGDLLKTGGDMIETGNDLKALAGTLETALGKAQREPVEGKIHLAPDGKIILSDPSPTEPEPAAPLSPAIGEQETVAFRGLTKPAQKILRVVAAHRGGIVESDTLFFLAGVSGTNSGQTRAALTELRRNGWITPDKDGGYASTDAGEVVAGIDPTAASADVTAAIMALWEPRLGENTNGGDALHILRLLVAQRQKYLNVGGDVEGINRPELAGHIGIKIGVRFDAAIALLNKHELIYREKGEYIASAAFFPILDFKDGG